MFDLQKLETQLAQYFTQRGQYQEMFHKLCGAIEALQILINEVKETRKEIKDGETDDKSTQEPSQE